MNIWHVCVQLPELYGFWNSIVYGFVNGIVYTVAWAYKES
jgi:hypothetical protein